MNLFLITLDDVNFYNLGFTNYFEHYSSPTPNIDRLSKESYIFWNAHCNIPFCQPSRMVLLTGLYPQNNGSLSFQPIKYNIKTLSSILKTNNYQTQIIGKVFHHEPQSCFDWNKKEKFWTSNIIKSIDNSIDNNENNFFLINIENTHRPFYFDFTNGIPAGYKSDHFTDEIIKTKIKQDLPLFKGKIPSNLPDTPTIRKDFYSFFKSLKKADDIIGDIISLVKDEDYLVLTSDHGFSFPYFKGNCYGSSTNVPLIIKGKNIIKKHDKDNLVSHVDFVPTILELLQIKLDLFFDGKSYAKFLFGEHQEGFDVVYTQLNKMRTGGNSRIRSLTNKEYSYCLNFDVYNAECVDGWGWNNILKEMKNFKKFKDWKHRPYEELISYSEMDFERIENQKIKKNLKKKLFHFMKKYGDDIIKNKLI